MCIMKVGRKAEREATRWVIGAKGVGKMGAGNPTKYISFENGIMLSNIFYTNFKIRLNYKQKVIVTSGEHMPPRFVSVPHDVCPPRFVCPVMSAHQGL